MANMKLLSFGPIPLLNHSARGRIGKSSLATKGVKTEMDKPSYILGNNKLRKETLDNTARKLLE